MGYNYGPDEESDKIAAGRGILIGVAAGWGLIAVVAYAVNMIF